DTLLAGGHENDRLHPQVHLDLGLFEDGADLHRELPLAVAAAPQADADALLGVGLDLRDPIDAAAVRADRAIGPEHAFHELVGGGFVVKVGGAKLAHDSL